MGRCRRFLFAVMAFGLPTCLVGHAQAPARTTEEGKNEVLWLDRLCEVEYWHPVEECRTRVSALECPWGGKVLQLHFEVDHHSGEKKYPVGWPRAHLNPLGWERNWLAWDRIEFMVRAQTSREALPKAALTFEFGDTRPVYNPSLEFAELDKWTVVSMPVAEIMAKSPILKGGISRLRWVVSESSYKHGDVLDFHVGGFRLVRSLVCEITELSAATPVIYAGQPFITLGITVVGPPADVKRGVPFTIRSGERVARHEMLPLGRGKQLYECDISELALVPGDYELVVFEGDEGRARSVSLRVVEEPWKQK
ncbi:MAG: hypothetical protein HN742_33250 [Lentisphaerae bacterium]|nr:hypothetical protein [Lentisphaerota bacterium]MBT4815964.1 hypothetical protein [Lentisphaerota bacterium]MBT5606563.1 hypothetical protein [Lentisphaerota bacterium]MBT7053472.1 hypothetical protein [Lentisphaerota bacterium]MBT7846785.1 hypothetical protein [Lentisphaerota bacterium]